jgi:hypothetical protein
MQYRTPTLILNIGLNVRGGGRNTMTQTLQALERTGFAVNRLALVHSDTEPTLVAEVDSDSNWGVSDHQATALYGVAVCLGQEAIAAFEPNRGHGVLVGPDAASWGKFDATQFFTVDGRRLVRKPAGQTWLGVTRDQSEDRGQPFTLEQLAALGLSSVGQAA